MAPDEAYPLARAAVTAALAIDPGLAKPMPCSLCQDAQNTIGPVRREIQTGARAQPQQRRRVRLLRTLCSALGALRRRRSRCSSARRSSTRSSIDGHRE